MSGGDAVRSTPQAFAADLQWDEALELPLSAGTKPPFAVEIKMLERDADAPAATGSTELSEAAGSECTMQLVGGESGEETVAWVSWEVVKTEPYKGFGWLGNPSKFQRLLKEKDQFLEEYFQLAILQVNRQPETKHRKGEVAAAHFCGAAHRCHHRSHVLTDCIVWRDVRRRASKRNWPLAA